MSTTSQVTTYSDLYTDLQVRTRETTGVTATENIAKRPHFRPVILAWQSKIEQHYIRFNVLLRNTGLK